MVRAGDLDGRRGIYVRSHCEKLHGLEREALKHAEFAGGWNNVSPAPDTIELPEYQGRPYFHSDYWDLYWKKFPDQVPSKGNTPEECMNNYKDFVSTKSPAQKKIVLRRCKCSKATLLTSPI